MSLSWLNLSTIDWGKYVNLNLIYSGFQEEIRIYSFNTIIMKYATLSVFFYSIFIIKLFCDNQNQISNIKRYIHEVTSLVSCTLV